MKCLIWSPKGGCGKTSISVVLKEVLQAQIITNDRNNPYNLLYKENDDYYLLPENIDIPTFNNQNVNVIYDMGGYADKRIKDFIVNIKDLIILIPFNPDIVSFQSAIAIYNEIKELSENIIFIINRAKKGDYDIFREQMEKMNIKKALLEVKESKLFQNIFNKREKIEDVKNNKLLKHTYSPAFKQIDNLVKELRK